MWSSLFHALHHTPSACASDSIDGLEQVEELLYRLRDNDAHGTSVSEALTFLTEAQRAVNAQRAFVVREDALILTPRQAFYSVSSIAPRSARIIGVRYQGRDLAPTPWEHGLLSEEDSLLPSFEEPYGFSLIGRDLLCVLPVQASAREVLIVSAALIDPIEADHCGELTRTEMADAYLIAELLAYVRMRHVAGIQRLLGQERPRE